jgi:hypothetical protein
MNTIRTILVVCSIFVLFSCASNSRHAHQYCLNQGLTAGTERYQECYEKRVVKIKIVFAKKESRPAAGKRHGQEGVPPAYGRTTDSHDAAAEQKRLEHEQKRLNKEARKEDHRQAKEERAERKRLEYEQRRLEKAARKEDHHQAKEDRAEHKCHEHEHGHLDKEAGMEGHHQAAEAKGNKPRAAKKGHSSHRSASAVSKGAKVSGVPGP